jgi:PAS domain S-box-containing protein
LVSKIISDYNNKYPDLDIDCSFHKQKELLKSIGGAKYLLEGRQIPYYEESLTFLKDKLDANKSLDSENLYFINEINDTINVPIFCNDEIIGIAFGRKSNIKPNIINSVGIQLSRFITKTFFTKKIKSLESRANIKDLEFESIVQLTNMLSFCDNLSNETLEYILIHLVSLYAASKGMFILRDSNTNIFEVRATFEIREEDMPRRMLTDNKGLLAELKNTKKTFLVESDKFNLVKFVEHNSICSPIYFRGNLLGCIILADKESRKGFIHFSDLDANLFDSLTKEISLTINNLKLIDDLQSTNNLIDNIMTSIEAGIIKFTEFGEIEYVNKKAIEIIGIERDLIQNQHYGIIFADNELFLEVISNYELAESDNQAQVVKNVPFKSFNGTIHTLDTTITPVYDKDKDRSGYILSFDDISDMQKVKTTFKKYVSGNIVDEILDDNSKSNLGGTLSDACVLFADIRGFTSFSEKTSASELVSILNKYFTEMIDIVYEYNGTLDKIIGDELMVLFGVPNNTEHDCQNAVDCAIAMFKRLDEFNDILEKSHNHKLMIGVGIHYGEVVAGNIGSDKQMNYTVIGDNVNQAARFCSNASPNEIVISEDVYKNISHQNLFSESILINVKGKDNAIPVRKFTHFSI